MQYFSLFSGIGGFEYGIEKTYQTIQRRRCETPYPSNDLPMSRSGSQRGWGNEQSPSCIGFSEIDRYAIQIYKKHFPTHKEYGNVTNIKWSNVPDFELLVAGFPCQSFSIAGKRKGFNDIRGTLFFEIARATQEKQPRLLFLENVKGLLSHDKGRTFGTILNTLDELGYDLQWQVLNSKNFGVPQNRERVFIIGHLRTTSRPQVFPLQQGNSDTIPENKETEKQFANTITGKYGTGNARGTHLLINKKGGKKRTQETASCLSGGAHSGGNHSDMDLLLKEMKNGKLDDRTLESKAGFQENGDMSGMQRKKENRVSSQKRGLARPSTREHSRDMSQLPQQDTSSQRKMQDLQQTDERSGVLRETLSEIQEIRQSQDVQKKPTYSDYRIRRLTPLEAERLQGFPDGWTAGISDTQRYKCLGNAVTTNVISTIMEKLLDSLWRICYNKAK